MADDAPGAGAAVVRVDDERRVHARGEAVRRVGVELARAVGAGVAHHHHTGTEPATEQRAIDLAGGAKDGVTHQGSQVVGARGSKHPFGTNQIQQRETESEREMERGRERWRGSEICRETWRETERDGH